VYTQIKLSFCPHSVFVRSVWISVQAVTISLHSINWLVFRRIAKLRKAIISLVMYVRPARMEHLGSHWTDFNEIRYLSFFFENLSREFKFH